VFTVGWEGDAVQGAGEAGGTPGASAWGFAQAAGQQVTVPEGLAAFVLDVAGQIITPESCGGGSFADAVPVGPDVHVMDRLVAFTGRALAGHTAQSTSQT
jgi:hypothetical protein